MDATGLVSISGPLCVFLHSYICKWRGPAWSLSGFPRVDVALEPLEALSLLSPAHERSGAVKIAHKTHTEIRPPG